MALIHDDGTAIEFGQALAEVERMFGCSATDNPLSVARKSIDQLIELENVSLEFDSGRLRSFTLENGYAFVHAPTPFPEDWKNLVPVAARCIVKQMSRDNFLDYISFWELRAKSLGAERVEFGDLEPHHYSISVKRDRFIDSVGISMGPSRRTRRGGIWCDGWHAFFRITPNQEGMPVYEGILKTLSASRDEFNTVARRT